MTIAGVEGLQGCLQHFQHEVCKAEFEGLVVCFEFFVFWDTCSVLLCPCLKFACH